MDKKMKTNLNVKDIAKKVLDRKEITKEEALYIYDQDLNQLQKYANKIREKFCSNKFDLCTIINAKSGNCSENCKFCAQSAKSCTQIQKYPLLSAQEIIRQAKINHEQGVLRYSIVTSGKKLSNKEVDEMCIAIKRIKDEVGISVCVSFGLLDEEQFKKIKKAGASRVHNNLETSKNNFPNICTTHTFEDKVKSIKAAKAAGLSVCSGGIMGLGETKQDRIDMAFSLKELGIKSVPINMLNPINGTPLGHNQILTKEDMQRIVATYRFILPDASIRLAGGRGLLEDKGEACFSSGANAAISGDMLTTVGITVKKDIQMLTALNYEIGFFKKD